MDKVSGIANKLGGNKGQEYIDKGELRCLYSRALRLEVNNNRYSHHGEEDRC